MNKDKSIYSLFIFFIDIILLTASFFAINYFKRGTFRLPPEYINILIAFYIIWLFVSLFIKKFRINSYNRYFKSILLFFKSTILIAYGVSFLVVVTGISLFSRLHIFGTCVLFFFIEIVLFTIFYSIYGKNKISSQKEAKEIKINKPLISIFLLISDFLLVTFSFYLMNFLKRGTFRLSSEYENILFFIYGIWVINSFIAQKFNKRNFQNYHYSMAACIKAFILMIASMSVIIFAFRLFRFSRLHIFGTFFFLVLFESVIYYLYFIFKFVKNVNGDIESPEAITKFLEQKKLQIEEKKSQEKILNPSFMKFIIDNFFESSPKLFEFIKDRVNLAKIKDSEIAILNSQDIFNIEILDNKSLKLFINLYKLNDIRWINRYFLEVHKKLINGGYFIGRAVTIKEHKKKFFKKYPKYYAQFFYILNFIFYRVFPKLPELKKLYFALTKGKGRLISKAEILGRLYFCGFEVINEKEIADNFFFIAQKDKTPSIDTSPSYGPIIKLKRIGLNGNIIYIYKLRTMYPYSEYLQSYIYKHHKLKKGGKIKDDFRITEWGRFMRKYWLDELPMIYNWIRGDVKLFGVRPLSMHYLSLYNKRLREMRKKIKPGLIPPFYADLPTKFKDIIESEMRYIQTYLKNPIKTQCIYFFKTLNNILIKGARSR